MVQVDLGGRERPLGRKKYRDATSWRLDGAMPADIADLDVHECKPGNAPRLMFSATDASVATEIERAFAAAGHIVVSNSRNHRMEADVPLLVPEVNYDHLKVIPRQQRERGWKGQIVTNPNCSTIVMTLALAPLKKFGIERILVTTLQAISGAGYPGVASMDINANVIPFIGNEEEKMESETQKILGDFVNGEFRPLDRKSQRAVQSRACGRWPPVLRLRRTETETGYRRRFARRSKPSPACRSRRTCRARRRARSSIWNSRIVRSRAAMSNVKTEWLSSSAACGSAPCSITSSSPAVTTPFAEQRARLC